MVTGRSGACGKMKRRARFSGNGSSRTMGTKSQPSAPSPCIQMTGPEGSAPVLSSTCRRGFNALAPRCADGGLGTECLDHFGARFDVGTADEVDAIGNRGEDSRDDHLALGGFQAFERLADRFRLARG